MKLDNATVLITGAKRGIGLAFAREALARGARKVCAGARDPAYLRFARSPGAEEVLADERAQDIKQRLLAEPSIYLRDPSS